MATAFGAIGLAWTATTAGFVVPELFAATTVFGCEVGFTTATAGFAAAGTLAALACPGFTFACGAVFPCTATVAGFAEAATFLATLGCDGFELVATAGFAGTDAGFAEAEACGVAEVAGFAATTAVLAFAVLAFAVLAFAVAGFAELVFAAPVFAGLELALVWPALAAVFVPAVAGFPLTTAGCAAVCPLPEAWLAELCAAGVCARAAAESNMTMPKLRI